MKRGNSKQLQKDKDELNDKLHHLENAYDDLMKENDQLKRQAIVARVELPVKSARSKVCNNWLIDHYLIRYNKKHVQSKIL